MPLRASISERIGRELEAPPSLHHAAVLPAVPRPAKDVVALLLAATGLSLAARKDATVELLPGEPITILVCAGGRARAAFVLPVSEAEAAKITGQQPKARRDQMMDVLWEEDRFADARLPEIELDRRRGEWESGHVC
jgi:hypothetical protein